MPDGVAQVCGREFAAADQLGEGRDLTAGHEVAHETRVVIGPDHMYTGEEAAVARTIAEWINSVVLPQSAGRSAPVR